ncbi:MAG: hypothetical protein QXX20_04695 [Candidatus Thermoplasmatota archaeon]
MVLNASENIRQLVAAFLLLLLPWIVILLLMILNIENIWAYLLSISWFGSGVIFFQSLYY